MGRPENVELKSLEFARAGRIPRYERRMRPLERAEQWADFLMNKATNNDEVEVALYYIGVHVKSYKESQE